MILTLITRILTCIDGICYHNIIIGEVCYQNKAPIYTYKHFEPLSDDEFNSLNIIIGGIHRIIKAHGHCDKHSSLISMMDLIIKTF